jgi:hypothetical protein
MKMSDLVGYIRLTRQGIKWFSRGLSTPLGFDGSIVSLLRVRHGYDSKINIISFLSWAHHFLFFFPFFHCFITQFSMSCFQHLLKNHYLSNLFVIIHPKPTRDPDALSISSFLVIDDNQLEFSTIIKGISLIPWFIQETPPRCMHPWDRTSKSLHTKIWAFGSFNI